MAEGGATRYRLADWLGLEVGYDDRTAYGSAVTGTVDTTLRKGAVSIVRYRERNGLPASVGASQRLLSSLFSGPWSALYTGPGKLRTACLYPRPDRVTPAGLVFTRDHQMLGTVRLPRALMSDLARWIGEWSVGASEPTDPLARRLWNTLWQLEAFERVTPERKRGRRQHGQLVGHASVAIQPRSAGNIVIDPYCPPSSSKYPATFQPIAPRELLPASAICITHSHPDHYDLGTLLRFGAETPIILPHVPRESLLAIDMAARLTQLGFRDVRVLRWFESCEVENARITALPFYGEQPTVGERWEPHVRNDGNAYLVEADGKRYAFVADAGRDLDGEPCMMATAARRRFGAIDVLFAGFRSFPHYPIHYVFSSLTRYLLFIPPELWQQRQKIMYDADEALDLAEVWGAKYMVPYACGGAPWHWMAGFGPVLDGSAQPERRTDPPPDMVVDAARWRAWTSAEPIPANVAVQILRPGDQFELGNKAIRIKRTEPHAWPY